MYGTLHSIHTDVKSHGITTGNVICKIDKCLSFQYWHTRNTDPTGNNGRATSPRIQKTNIEFGGLCTVIQWNRKHSKEQDRRSNIINPLRLERGVLVHVIKHKKELHG